MPSTTQDKSVNSYEEFPPLTEQSKAVLSSDMLGNCLLDLDGITTLEVQVIRRFFSAALREAMRQSYPGAVSGEQFRAWDQLSNIADNIHNIHPTPSQMHKLLQEMIDSNDAISLNNSATISQDKLRTLQRGLAHHLPA
jgi:hypothetical protein